MGVFSNLDYELRYPRSPGHRGVGSQIEAAKVIAPHMSRLQVKVLEAIDSLGGATIEEICDRTGIKLQSVCGRIGELKGLNRIKVAGFKRTNHSGVYARVWIRA